MIAKPEKSESGFWRPSIRYDSFQSALTLKHTKRAQNGENISPSSSRKDGGGPRKGAEEGGYVNSGARLRHKSGAERGACRSCGWGYKVTKPSNRKKAREQQGKTLFGIRSTMYFIVSPFRQNEIILSFFIARPRGGKILRLVLRGTLEKEIPQVGESKERLFHGIAPIPRQAIGREKRCSGRNVDGGNFAGKRSKAAKGETMN